MHLAITNIQVSIRYALYSKSKRSNFTLFVVNASQTSILPSWNEIEREFELSAQRPDE